MKKSFAVLPGLVFLSACSLIPDYTRPAVEAPPAWSEPAVEDSAAVARDWWRSFGSAELNSLMDEALAHNNDLQAALARIEQSRAILKIARSRVFPSADLSADVEHLRQTNPRSTDTSLGVNTGIGYELDLFGANRANIAAAEAEYAASGFDREALQLVVMADVAKTYFNVLNARDRLRIADDNLKNSREVLRIVSARFEAGASDALDVAQQKAALASAEAARASVARQISNAENALAVLVGKPPQSVKIAMQDLSALSVPAIAAGQPSTLLERRPDIQAAEAQLVAANADIGAAKAAYFPVVTLGLDWTLASSGFGDPVTSGLTASSALLAPIFQGGTIQGGVQQATARERELAENYRKTVLVSFQDVEDSLAAVKAAQARENALRTAMQEARTSYNLSKSRYEAGTIDFQTLLDAQRTLLQSEDAFATSKNERLAAAVDLFKALGGGWSADIGTGAPVTTVDPPAENPVPANIQ